MSLIDTPRLALRELTTEDAPFIFALVNDPDWLRHIGDRGVRTREDAEAYILNGPIAMYRRHGFGLYLVEAKDTGTPVGICGLLKRDALEDVDLGFALLPEHRGRGYAAEAAAAVLDHGRRVVGLRRIVAIVSPGNAASARALGRLGFRLERRAVLDGSGEVDLFALDI